MAAYRPTVQQKPTDQFQADHALSLTCIPIDAMPAMMKVSNAELDAEFASTVDLGFFEILRVLGAAYSTWIRCQASELD